MAGRPVAPAGRSPGRRRSATAIAATALILSACTTPTATFVDRARTHGLSVDTVAGTTYRHLVAVPDGTPVGGPVHVYLEHDGLPWRRVDAVSADPTPRRALALELMARDTADRVYVGRPCYFGHAQDPGCGPQQWTSHRYSDEVVRSLAAAVNRVLASRHPAGPSGPVVLIGYSGGGTLAWLIAPQVRGATTVVTVAANLDVGAWTAWHRFSPLVGSRDPAMEQPLPAGVRQIHLVGGRDANVPPALTRPVIDRQPNVALVEIAAFDHVCCWVDRWPALLGATLDAAAGATGPALSAREGCPPPCANTTSDADGLRGVGWRSRLEPMPPPAARPASVPLREVSSVGP